MSHKYKSTRITTLPVREIKVESGAEEPLRSPEMRPYLNFIRAAIQQKDAETALEKIATLPLEERYVWRIACALELAFGDFDSLTVEVDRHTLSTEDREQLDSMLALRSIQFSLFLKAWRGEAGDDGEGDDSNLPVAVGAA